MKQVIINADDFGQSAGVNSGVIDAHEHGVLTSASLMVRWPAAAAAASYARCRPQLGVGLHLDLGEWVFRDGDWARLYQVVDETDLPAVTAEVARQLEVFERLMGCAPTHIDSHQHSHRREPVRSAVLEVASRLNVPVRGISVPYCGDFYGQDGEGVSYPEWVGVDRLREILGNVGPGLTEVACHPSATADLDTMYSSERLSELATLCDPRIKASIAEFDIRLV
ncbi:MAG: ChbG/HpnK family deacetylase, partial [Vicinamibacterales bacterium]